MSEPPPRRARVRLTGEWDAPTAVLMAEFRNACPPGTDLDLLAEALADDLEAKAPALVTAATCAALARASADLQSLGVLGYAPQEILAVLGFAAAKLEMRCHE
jgi:hypothetical protein